MSERASMALRAVHARGRLGFDVPTLETLDGYVENRLLSRQDRGPLSIYNYTDRCTFARAWDVVTLQARGLIFDRRTGDCLARPFPKFFNLGERGIEQEIPEQEPDVVTVKYDGSLGISYIDPVTCRLTWATRGSFVSPQAEAANRIWSQREPCGIPEDYTLLVEIIAPESFNIVRYEREELILLGVRRRDTGADLDYRDVEVVGEHLGLRVAERVEESVLDLVARASRMDHTAEGFVVRWGDYRVKVKSSEYLRVARIITGMNERRIADLWYSRRTDLVEAIPEEFRAMVDETFSVMERDTAALIAEFQRLRDEVSGITDRRALVDAVGTKHPLFGCLMRSFDGKLVDLRDRAYRLRFDGPPRPAAGEDQP